VGPKIGTAQQQQQQQQQQDEGQRTRKRDVSARDGGPGVHASDMHAVSSQGRGGHVTQANISEATPAPEALVDKGLAYVDATRDHANADGAAAANAAAASKDATTDAQAQGAQAAQAAQAHLRKAAPPSRPFPPELLAHPGDKDIQIDLRHLDNPPPPAPKTSAPVLLYVAAGVDTLLGEFLPCSPAISLWHKILNMLIGPRWAA
jgi:hypothetical protein